jgi:hypothetical protein
MLRVVWLILSLPSVAVPAWGQDATLSDLNGVTVQLLGVFQGTYVRNGKTWNAKVYQTGSVTIEDNTIRSSFQITGIHSDGRKNVGPTRSFGPRAIGKPFKAESGNDVVWAFTDGGLSRLIVHTDSGAGASKLTIKFKRQPAGLACSFSYPVMRENGVGDIRRNAGTDGKPLQVLQFKQISANCTVAKGR